MDVKDELVSLVEHLSGVNDALSQLYGMLWYDRKRLEEDAPELGKIVKTLGEDIASGKVAVVCDPRCTTSSGGVTTFTVSYMRRV